MPGVFLTGCTATEDTPTLPRGRTFRSSTAAVSPVAAMAPGRAAKRSYRSAPERLRLLNCNSNTKQFEICPSESFSVSCLFVFLLACVVLLSHCASGQGLSARENIDCTYANSTCPSSTCGNLCLRGEFYPLFPSRCHPLYTVGACGIMFVKCRTTVTQFLLCIQHYTLLINRLSLKGTYV